MKSKENLFTELNNQTIINTHSHHYNEYQFEDFSLTTLFKNTYVFWSGIPLEDTYESRQNFLNQVRTKSYFVWLEKALQDLYSFDFALSADNWDQISYKISTKHQNKQWHLDILNNYCHYERNILDAYWDFGSNNQLPDYFSATFRIDAFMFGYEPTKEDHNNNSFYDIFNQTFKDLNSYVDFMQEVIKLKISNSCVALKSAIAYDRGLNFRETSHIAASQVFLKQQEDITSDDIKSFQDYTFFKLCQIAADFDVPFQIHTGLGKLESSNPMQLQELISKNPKTKFVLFHGGFPWTDDISGLLHVYTNVYADLCWLPLISPTAAKRALSEYLEVANINKLMWGCDTVTSEESYGAKLAMQDMVIDVLMHKIQSGYMSYDTALLFIKSFLYENPKKLYKL